MKKALFGLSITFALALLLCTCAFAETPSYEIKQELSFAYLKPLDELYAEGVYGDDLYVLKQNYCLNSSDPYYLIFKKDKTAKVIYFFDWNNYKETILTDEQYKEFTEFIDGEKIDELPDWNTHQVSDGYDYTYSHYSKDKTVNVNINNPGAIEDMNDTVYCLLVEKIKGYIDKNQEVYIDKNGIQDVVVNSDYYVSALYQKYGRLYAYARKDKDFSWYLVENGKLNEIDKAPSDAIFFEDFEKLPETDKKKSDSLNYDLLYQEWNGKYVVSNKDGLYLLSVDEEPQLLLEGDFWCLIVNPETGNLICIREIDEELTLVKINLTTLEISEIASPDEGQAYPCEYLNGKVLVDCKNKFYFLDEETNTLKISEGEFTPLYKYNTRLFQQTPVKGKYFAIDTKNHFGIYDTTNYSFEIICPLNTRFLYNDYIWVDVRESKLYFTFIKEILALPITLPEDILSAYKESPVIFDSPIIENERSLFNIDDVFSGMNIEYTFDEKTKTITAYNGDKNISLSINGDILKSGNSDIKLDVTAREIDGKVYVPIRAIAESLGFRVEWDDVNKEVQIFE